MCFTYHHSATHLPYKSPHTLVIAGRSWKKLTWRCSGRDRRRMVLMNHNQTGFVCFEKFCLLYHIACASIYLFMYIVLNIFSEASGGLWEGGCRSTSLNRFFKASGLVIIIIFTDHWQVLQLNQRSEEAVVCQGKPEAMSRALCGLLQRLAPRGVVALLRLPQGLLSVSAGVLTVVPPLCFPSLVWPMRRKREMS